MLRKSWLGRFFPTIFITILGFSTLNSHGQNRIFGQDLLALQYSKFEEQNILPYTTPGVALGSLDYSFGTEITPVSRLLSSGSFSFYRVHIINGTCIANGNCGTYEIGYGYTLKSFEGAVLTKNPKIIGFVKARTTLYCELSKKFPSVKFLISPILEHRLGVKAYRILADATITACPGVQLVNNPISGDGERYKGAWIESHDGFKKPREIVSFDGLDATDADINKWKKTTAPKTKIAFVWSRVYNCRNQGVWEDPRARTSCPKKRDFELLSHITDDRPPAPKPSFKCAFKPLNAPYTWKPMAEDKGVSDVRANLPVIIVPLSSHNISVVGKNGVSIGTLNYFGPYQNGLNRYYSGTGIKLSGYQIEKKLINTNNSPWAWVKDGVKCIGPFIAGYRGGSYR